MSDYKKTVKDEAERFYASAEKDFAQDESEFGGKSAQPSLLRWVDASGRLSARVEEIAAKWSHKDHLWVETNTRSRAKHSGGDKASNAFVSFLQDVRQAIKKLSKR